jgi:K+-sensing histidine kinase KdpD
MSTPAPRELIRLSVRDNGTGMDAATLAEIFQPFFTTKPSGTGTNLAWRRCMASSRYGGAIRVESEAGVGTQFDVFPPAAVAPSVVEETESWWSRQSPRRILRSTMRWTCRRFAPSCGISAMTR